MWLSIVQFFVSIATLSVVWFFANEARIDRLADRVFRQEEHARKFRAAKASLPMALGKMCEYTDKMARYLTIVCNDISVALPAMPHENEVEEPVLDIDVDDILTVFYVCIEHGPKCDDNIDNIELLIQRLQTFKARLDGSLDRFYRPNIGPIENLGTVDEMAARFIELATLRAITDRLFAFARGREPREDEVTFDQHVYKVIGFWDLDYEKIPNLKDILARKY